MFSAFMQAVAQETLNMFSKAIFENKWKFIPGQEDSWDSIQLSNKTIENLALSV